MPASNRDARMAYFKGIRALAVPRSVPFSNDYIVTFPFSPSLISTGGALKVPCSINCIQRYAVETPHWSHGKEKGAEAKCMVRHV